MPASTRPILLITTCFREWVDGQRNLVPQKEGQQCIHQSPKFTD